MLGQGPHEGRSSLLPAPLLITFLMKPITLKVVICQKTEGRGEQSL